MNWFLYIALGFTIVLCIGFIGGMIVAGLIDWYNYRKNRVFVELQRDYNKKRRPVAK